jgi:uncharacterized protein DUF4252
MSSRWAAFLALGLTLPALCQSQPPALKLPPLTDMQRDAVESVNITLGPLALGFARFVMGHAAEHDPEAAQMSEVLHGVKKVQVHNFSFRHDHVYSQTELDSLRSQLTSSEWHQMLQVRNQESHEDVDIYCAMDDKMITGLVILVAEPREFTLVNIAGEIDPNQIAALRQTFGHGPHGVSQMALTRPEDDGSRETPAP